MLERVVAKRCGGPDFRAYGLSMRSNETERLNSLRGGNLVNLIADVNCRKELRAANL